VASPGEDTTDRSDVPPHPHAGDLLALHVRGDAMTTQATADSLAEVEAPIREALRAVSGGGTCCT